MEESINSIVDNVFYYVSINKQENVEQWKKDKEEFKEQLIIEINSIPDKEVRNTVLTRLLKDSQNENGQKFVNTNGTVNIGKIKESTKAIQIQVEKEITAKRESAQTTKEVLKKGVISATEHELQVKKIREDFKDILPDDMPAELKERFIAKVADMELLAREYLTLIKNGVTEEMALKKLNISLKEIGMFKKTIEKVVSDDKIADLENIARGDGEEAKRAKTELNAEEMHNQDIKQEMAEIFLKLEQDKGITSETIAMNKEFAESAEGIANTKEMNQKIEEVIPVTQKDQIKEILIGAIDEGFDNIDDFREFVEASLDEIADEELRGKVSQAIEQLTQSQSLGDSGKSFEELLEAGELDESIIDSALSAQSQEMEQEEKAIQDNVTSVVYIEKGESFTVDEKWEKLCQDAQERGESLNGPNLERLLSQYMEGQGLEPIEAPKNPPSTLGEKAGEENELTGSKPPVVENPEVIQNVTQQNPRTAHNLQENGEDRGEDEDKNSVVRREYADKDGNKKTVLITNDSNGEIANVQVFNPIDFVKNSKATTTQVNTVTAELRALGEAEKNINSREGSSGQDKEDVLE